MYNILLSALIDNITLLHVKRCYTKDNKDLQ